MSDLNINFYKQDLLDHAKNPRNFGVLEVCDFRSEQFNPSCGDAVTIFGVVLDNKLQMVTFQGVGCVICIAMASKLTEYTQGMSLQSIEQLNEALVPELLGISLGLNRLRCGLLPLVALQAGIQMYLSRPLK